MAQLSRSRSVTVREFTEYLALLLLVKGIGSLPRQLARLLGRFIGIAASILMVRLRRTGMANLLLAFPEWSESARAEILRQVFTNLGYQLAEFCLMPAV